MGTISERVRKDGSMGFTVQIRIKRGGKVVYTEAKTFDRKPAAAQWMKRREKELDGPGAIEAMKAEDPVLRDVILKYEKELHGEMGRTKAQVLRTIKGMTIADMRCSEIRSLNIVAFAREMESSPATVSNYVSHLGAIFAIAKPAWGYPLNLVEMSDARAVLKRMGTIAKSRERVRRPTLEELDMLMLHFSKPPARRKDMVPMKTLMAFAIFSTRRIEEICRITREGLDLKTGQILVKDMKHPGEKSGNDVWCDLPPEAVRIARAQPGKKGLIFPYNARSVSASFTRACKILGIEDLHFHDLRHDGVSRLFELGNGIPQVALVSGHRNWTSLKRYTHIRQDGDKYAGWRWLDDVAPVKNATARTL